VHEKPQIVSVGAATQNHARSILKCR